MEEIWAFIADWFDPHAQLTRQYLVKYFVSSHTVEMVDKKNRKLFLKKSPCPPGIEKADFYVGSRLTIHSRQLQLVEFADNFTREKLGSKSATTFGLIKPDGISQLGKILAEISESGFQLVEMKMCMLDANQASEYYKKCVFDNVPQAAISHLASGPVVAIVVCAQDSGKEFIRVCEGLRKQFAASTIEDAIAPADSPDEAKLQKDFFFGKKMASTATYDNNTCCVIRPHCVRAGKAGEIINIILETGYEISALGLFRLQEAEAKEFLEVYEGVIPTYKEAVKELMHGPCIAMELRSQDAVTMFRETAGPWDVDMARQLRPNSIRAKYGKNEVQNAVHCTDLPQDATSECEFFFDLMQG